MSELKEYLNLKEQVEKARQQAAKAEGALEQILKQLKEKFGCNSLKEAKALLKQIQKKEKKAREELDQAMKDFKAKWKD